MMARPRHEPAIDRTKVCPLLLRVFIKLGEHHTAEDFDGKLPLEDEVIIYTWKDATLDELTKLVKSVKRAARQPNVRLTFAFVYPGTSGKNVLRKAGETFGNRRSPDDFKTLNSLRFETGDYLDVAIHVE